MRHSAVLAAAAVVIFAATSGALAFSTQTSNPAMDRTTSNRLADPEDLMDSASTPQLGGGGTSIMHFGGMTTQFSTPSSSPFLDNSTAGFGPTIRDR